MGKIKGSKGLELPLNMIVLIIIAVLVLLVIGAYFAINTGEQFGTVNDVTARETGCAQWRATQCSTNPDYTQITIEGYTVGSNDAQGTLADACRETGFTTRDLCKQACICG